jgi:pimeloyl-ACP methyl ester carboxylesterase
MSLVVERTLRANGLSFNLAEAGDGPPVLLLHGFPDSWRLWRHQLTALAKAGHRVIAPDLRGFGKTDRPAGVEEYKLRTLVADVVGLLDVLHVDRAAVVGHDWGAALARAVTRFVPDRVTRLVVVSVGHPIAGAAARAGPAAAVLVHALVPVPGRGRAGAPQGRLGVLPPLGLERRRPGEDPDADRQVGDLSRPGALTTGLNWYRANVNPATFVISDPTRISVPPVACPTMGVWSSGDFALTEAQMTGSQRFVTGPWRYERLDGIDHWVPVHAPERLNELLVDFLG